jgi:phosphopantothenoylcysteine decarboxylase/phosphopantothenate--cysteine ligase
MIISILENKRILLGVTGSIACYKAADLASKLRQAGASVTTVHSQAATHFVPPMTFQSVTGAPAYTDEALWGHEGHVLHVGLAERTDLIVIAPCTANTLAKLANGQADTLLTLTALAARSPLLLAPAMDGGMFEHPATQANLETLHQRGATILGPARGHLASGLAGIGRMLEPDELIGHIRLALARSGPLHGREVVITAGGTREPIDPVREITNRSSGKQGYALAQAALDLGAQVTLVTAPTSLPTPVGSKKVDVRTAQEMLDAVLEACRKADVLLMAAAVADFTPAAPEVNKIKKRDGIPQIALKTAPDILGAVNRQKSETDCPGLMVGFAAESRDLESNAREKMHAKKLDLMVANDVLEPGSGFAVDTNRVTLLFPDSNVEVLPKMSKVQVAERVLAEVVAALEVR